MLDIVEAFRNHDANGCWEVGTPPNRYHPRSCPAETRMDGQVSKVMCPLKLISSCSVQDLSKHVASCRDITIIYYGAMKVTLQGRGEDNIVDTSTGRGRGNKGRM